MATRLERWRKYRARVLRRAKQQRNRGLEWENPTAGTGAGGARRRIGRKWTHEDRGLLPPCFVSAALKTHGEVSGGAPPFVVISVLPAKRRLPPVPFITGTVYDAKREIHHASFALHGYHRRRCHAWGRKSTPKMNGRTRRLWYEAIFFLRNGYFRDIDPLGRHPSETDIDNGALPDPNPAWPGIPE